MCIHVRASAAAVNTPQEVPQCWLGPQLQKVAKEVSGWKLGPGGYESGQPGSSLVLQLDLSLGRANPNTKVPIMFTFATSKEGMGQVELS